LENFVSLKTQTHFSSFNTWTRVFYYAYCVRCLCRVSKTEQQPHAGNFVKSGPNFKTIVKFPMKPIKY